MGVGEGAEGEEIDEGRRGSVKGPRGADGEEMGESGRFGGRPKGKWKFITLGYVTESSNAEECADTDSTGKRLSLGEKGPPWSTMKEELERLGRCIPEIMTFARICGKWGTPRSKAITSGSKKSRFVSELADRKSVV